MLACTVPSRGPEHPGNLKRDNRLSGAGGHCQEYAAASTDDGLDRLLDCVRLVVANLLDRGQIRRDEQPSRHIVLRKTLGSSESLPEVAWRRKSLDFALNPCTAIELDDALTVC